MVDFKLGSQDKALQLSGQSRGFISPRSQVQIPPEPSTPFLEIRVLLQNFLIFQKEKWLSGRKQQIANLSYIFCTQGSNPCFSFIRNQTKQNVDIFQKLVNILNSKLLYGIVVQLVRAPPCHGGSCEFESRQSRFFKFFQTL